MNHRVFVGVGGGLTFAVASYTGYALSRKESNKFAGDNSQLNGAGRVAVYDRIASTYDDKIGTDEVLMGM